MSVQEKKTEGKIDGAVYEVEVAHPIIDLGMVIRVTVKNGQDAVRAYLKLKTIAEAVMKR